jgi:phosphohistidine phosphatase
LARRSARPGRIGASFSIRLSVVKHLHLLRHAKSSWDDPGLADHERPLAPRGRRDCKKLAKHLRRHEVRPDLVLCSSSQRTRDTLELIRSALGDAAIEIEDGLYAAGSERLLARLRELPESAGSVLLIGHNPGLQDLALELAPGTTRLAEKFPTGALASFALDGPWSRVGDATTELLELVAPRELP